MPKENFPHCLMFAIFFRERGGMGLHNSLKNCRSYGHVSSILTARTLLREASTPVYENSERTPRRFSCGDEFKRKPSGSGTESDVKQKRVEPFGRSVRTVSEGWETRSRVALASR